MAFSATGACTNRSMSRPREANSASVIADVCSTVTLDRKRALHTIARVVEESDDERVLLMGDFNTPADSVHFASLRQPCATPSRRPVMATPRHGPALWHAFILTMFGRPRKSTFCVADTDGHGIPTTGPLWLKSRSRSLKTLGNLSEEFRNQNHGRSAERQPLVNRSAAPHCGRRTAGVTTTPQTSHVFRRRRGRNPRRSRCRTVCRAS